MNERFSISQPVKLLALTGLVIVYTLVEAEACPAEFIDGVSIFDVVADLVVDNASGV